MIRKLVEYSGSCWFRTEHADETSYRDVKGIVIVNFTDEADMIAKVNEYVVAPFKKFADNARLHKMKIKLVDEIGDERAVGVDHNL